MQTSQPSVFARDHTILGVCEALGEDFGFNPVLIRIPLAVCLLIMPWTVIAAYLGLAVLVGFTRFVSPNPKPAAAPEAEAKAEAEAEAAEAWSGERAEPELALAA